MPRHLSVVLALVVAGLLGPGLTLAQQDPLQASTKTVNVELILDASGSMAETLPGGETRMETAKRILRQVITDLPEREGVNVGLRVYGHLGDNTQTGKAVSCRSSELLVPVAGLDKAALIQQVEAIQPTGWTPIAYSLEQATADFQPGGESITNAIVLVTDGEETCDPPEQACQAAAALHQAGISVTTHVVGFALTPQQTEQVSCIAEQGGGQLFGADNAQQLGSALSSAMAATGVIGTPMPLTPVAAAPPLADIRTLAYHQLTA
jgi:Ca-activated chloride channel homolog